MAGERIYSCILFLAIIVLTSNQKCHAARNLRQSLSPPVLGMPRHFVLVHGACHGAWCWYKLQTLLEAAGHNVTSIDMSASGINLRSLDELHTFVDYTQPLLDFMESIPEGEKVILVGHSGGGLNLAYAMEQYPQKISVAVFISAVMPDTIHSPSYIQDQFPQFVEQYGLNNMFDTQYALFGRPEDNRTAFVFDHDYISSRLYQLSPPEDVTLAESLLRPTYFSWEDLANRGPFSNETYGSVKRAFVVCKEDNNSPIEFQYWNIKNSGAAIVKEIEGADHMAMISQPEKLYQSLLDIANSFPQEIMPPSDIIVSQLAKYYAYI